MRFFRKLPGRLNLARRLAQGGDEARDRGAHSRAAKLYSRALKLDPTRTDIHVQYGNMLKEVGRYEEAEGAYRRALSQSPGDGEIHLQLGHLLKLTGRTEQAAEAYEEAKRLLPDSTIPSLELRNLRARPPQSGSDALLDEPECETHIREGDRLRDAKRYADAAEAYGKALALAPSRTDIRVQYGNMLKDSGQLAEAESVYRSALTERPDDADIHLQLGHCLKLRGRRPAALEAYLRASTLDHMGQPRDQEYLFEAQLRLAGVEALTIITHQILELRAMLNQLAISLPDIQAQMAFPVSCYDSFRAFFDVPRPPRVAASYSFAVLLIADQEPLETLFAQLGAIRSQTYEKWTLCVFGSDPARRRIVERAASSDARIQWRDKMSEETPAETERRIALSSSVDWIILLAQRALLHPRAIEWFASLVGQGAATAFITDEETGIRKRGYVRRSSPQFRQVVDYDTLLEMNTCGETVAVELASYASVAQKLVTTSVSAARSSLLLALAREGRVGHIPCPLICRDGGNTIDPETVAATHEEAVRAHMAQAFLGERLHIGSPSGSLPRLPILWRPQDPDRSITIIIPTRDNAPDVAQFVDSLRARAAVPNALRIVIVDNGSRQAETHRILAELEAKTQTQVLVLDEPFNWSRLNNRAVEVVDSRLLIFANDDMVMLSEKWDERVRGLLERPEIGAVGARLLYKDDTVQHAGVLFGWKGSVIHDGLYQSCLEPGPASRWHVSRAVGAVTGAFLATRRDDFLAHHGFDELNLAVSFSDIDYALKLRASGLKLLWTPEITLYHHESKTRGLDHLDPEKSARDAAERTVMEARWGAAMLADPSVNPVWHMATLPFSLLSAPSPFRIWDHIRRCAAANPWLPESNSPSSPLRSKASYVGS
jgi:tetratricopeptide (TPR) repeat protein/GT2 family glycosyltransferase